VKEITRLMINEYKLKQLGFDFMGYTLQKNDIYTYHHLIIPKRHNGPMTKENGAILCGSTSHPYLHLIENYDYERFLAITSEMIDQNTKGKLDPENILYIYDILESFEREYSGKRNKKGKEIIKPEYTKRLIKK
jgi:hypothetical protein